MVQGDKLREWKRENMYRLSIDLNREKDAPIIDKLEEQPNKADYVRRLIQRDIDGESE